MHPTHLKIPLMSEKIMRMLLTLLFTSLAFFGLSEFGLFHWDLMISSTNACLIIARASTAHFLRSAQNLMLFLCRTHCEIAVGTGAILEWMEANLMPRD
jgi:hypothetical protein